MPGELTAVATAQERVLAATHVLDPRPVAVAEALGLVLAQDVVAGGDLPPFPSSAMDGYALHAGSAGRTLRVTGESRAGAPTQLAVGPEDAVRISTGAAVPPGATAVIRQEDTAERDGRVTVRTAVSDGQNIRAAGEVMRTGDRVLAAGTRLGPAELGIAVAAGAGQVPATPRPRVQVLCTGDELRDPGAALRPGQIHNSNGPMLAAYARLEGAVVTAPQLLGDDPTATENALAPALDTADVVIVSGGVSVGPHDHVKPALVRLGVDESFWGVALQPGKPTWFGSRERTLVFGLPGNPVSAAVTFCLFVAPALRRLRADADPRRGPDQAQLAEAVQRKPSRDQALRVRLERRRGTTLAVVNGPQGSHVLTSLVGADALALIPAGEGALEPGTSVALHPLPRYTLSA